MKRRFFSLLVLAVLGPVLAGCKNPAEGKPETAVSRSYLFCFWNVENFFDDRADGRKGPGDKEYDGWFADNPVVLKLKLARLCEALLKLNDGKGPDILALAEVESLRAAELLQQALNAKLPDPSLHYTSVLMKEISAGRHIAPAILTRLPAVKNRTRTHGRQLRILEGHIVVEGHDLVVLASHWTSRLRPGSEKGRASYGDQLYGTFRAMHRSNPAVDLLICGDFNDTPEDVSVTDHLRASGDRDAVLKTQDPPRLLDLFAGRDPAKGFGTHYHRKWLIFDQVVVSPGMLDQAGWACLPDSVQTVNTLYRPGDRLRRPWRFGGPNQKGDRGFSDHFPVTVRLQVQK